MIDLTALSSRFEKIAVLGLGVSGQAVITALQDNKLNFTVWDDDADKRQKALDEKHVVADPTQTLGKSDLVIRSVGIAPHHPTIVALEINGVTLWNDLDLLYFANPQARYLGITGTNGKSTTTSLIGHILAENNVSVAIGGNLGPAATSLATLGADGIYVLELSSYQLATSKLLRCDVAILLNITEDHVDWHGSMDDYIAAKALIFRPRDHHTQQAIIGIDTVPSHALYATLNQSPNHDVTAVTQTNAAANGPVTGSYNNQFLDRDQPQQGWTYHPVLKGRHNDENRLVAYAASRALGLTPEQIFKTMATFTGLKHRQQPVATAGAVTFINDSKATNADATAKALAVFDNIYWILGGKDKSDGIDGLDVHYPKIKQAYLIGAATERFAAELDGIVPFTRSETIAKATRLAYADAQASGEPAVILLSPACASFDQYANFEQRGDDFILTVKQILDGALA
jgi:UDP-N-acetylmuramoylalanine--D-glutamate ligase